MRLQFVGCGDALGSGGRYNTCFHVTGERVNFLIDCGASSLPALKRLDIARDAIDLILITQFSRRPFCRAAVSAAGRPIHAPQPAAGDRRTRRH
jgi:Cft2 family RNA processing exonuclease